MTRWLSIVGLGEDGLDALTPAARALIEGAEVLIGGERHLALAAAAVNGAETLTWRQPLADTVADIEARRGKRVVVLATGDPMCFGIGVTLGRHFRWGEMCVLPAPGAFSLAAARMGWPVQEATCLTLHGRPLDLVRLHVTPGARLLIMSEDGHTPAKVAAVLTDLGYGPSELTVHEHMDGAAERYVTATAEGWGGRTVADLNTIAMECPAGPNALVLSRAPGLPDDAFVHDGQITKRVVRAATLSALVPLPGQCLCDLGAGCGSVAIEWLRAAPGSHAHAVERDPARAALIAQNAAALGVPDLHVIIDDALAALPALDPPDAIFIGGGVAAPGLVEACWSALAPGARLVANAVTLDSEATLLAAQSHHGGALTRISVAEVEMLGRQHAWRPKLPVTQWAACKPLDVSSRPSAVGR